MLIFVGVVAARAGSATRDVGTAHDRTRSRGDDVTLCDVVMWSSSRDCHVTRSAFACYVTMASHPCTGDVQGRVIGFRPEVRWSVNIVCVMRWQMRRRCACGSKSISTLCTWHSSSIRVYCSSFISVGNRQRGKCITLAWFYYGLLGVPYSSRRKMSIINTGVVYIRILTVRTTGREMVFQKGSR